MTFYMFSLFGLRNIYDEKSTEDKLKSLGGLVSPKLKKKENQKWKTRNFIESIEERYRFKF